MPLLLFALNEIFEDGPAGEPALPSRPPQPTVTIPAPPPEFGRPELSDALDELESENPQAFRNAITKLSLVLGDPKTPADARRAILLRLVTLVHDRSPRMPGSATFEYCFKQAHQSYPTDVTLALRTIGSTRQHNLDVPVDLSGLNLAYVSLQELDLRNVRFDGALLCRAFLSSNFDGATFREANMRFALMEGSTGLTESQLAAARSIYRVGLPDGLKQSASLRHLLALDPEL